LLEEAGENRRLRAWVVGCSTGEEAYSLAMLFSEALQRRPDGHEFTIQIFASDISPEAIAKARRGEYPLSISERVSPERLAQFFTAHDTHYQIKPVIRDMVMFAQHDVVMDPPFTKLDLIACRNLLIYFDSALQRRLLPLFHYSLNPGGILLLGASGNRRALQNPVHTPGNQSAGLPAPPRQCLHRQPRAAVKIIPTIVRNEQGASHGLFQPA